MLTAKKKKLNEDYFFFCHNVMFHRASGILLVCSCGHFFCFNIGMMVCLGATPLGHSSYALLRHCWVALRHTKQNLVLHRVHTKLLQWRLLCSSSMPQLGQARIEGQLSTPFTSLKTMFGHCASMSRGLWQPLLSQRSERGPGPFHSFIHCQQNA